MPSSSTQVAHLGLEKLWKTTRGRGICVAVLDTGVISSPALPTARVRAIRADGGAPFVTSDTHGQACCSVVASSAPNAEGAAPEAEVLSIQIATSADAITAAQVARGLERALAEGCDVISCSFTLQSWAGKKDAIAGLVRDAHLAGVPVLASAGNVRGQSALFPEETQNAIVVSAHGKGGSALQVNYNDWTDVFCLGDKLTVVNGAGLKRLWPGKTSGATALTAGLAALALAAVPKAKRSKVGLALDSLLKNSATVFALPGGKTGRRVNAGKLITAALAV